MPLTMLDKRGKYFPVAVCDACGLALVRGEGNYEWSSDERQGMLYFSHKACSARLRAAHPELDCWNSIAALPVFLAANLGLTWQEC